MILKRFVKFDLFVAEVNNPTELGYFFGINFNSFYYSDLCSMCGVFSLKNQGLSRQGENKRTKRKFAKNAFDSLWPYC